MLAYKVNNFNPNRWSGNSRYTMSVPRPQFQNLGGRKRIPHNRMPHHQMLPPLPHTPSHQDDIIKFIFDSWVKVNREYCEQNFSDSGRNPMVTYYQEKEPNPMLKDFEPFDLDAWMGQRVVQNYQAASSSTS